MASFLPGSFTSAFLDPLVARSLAALKTEYDLLRDVHKEVRKLNTTLSMIRGFLEDAEEKQINNKAVHVWLGELKQVILKAEDVLDDYATRVAIMQRSENGSGSSNNSTTNMCSKLLLDIFNFSDTVRGIKTINESLDDIAKSINSLGLKNSFGRTTPTRLLTTSFLGDESYVLGRDEDICKILQMLLPPRNEAEPSNIRKNVHALVIHGIGGVGKTTLAQLVFNDEKVKEHFDLRLWVCLSDHIDVKKVTKEIIESSLKSNHGIHGSSYLHSMTNLDAIQHILVGVVKGKKFLLVLDDAGNNEDDIHNWELLFKPLQHGAKKSRVIVTTQNSKVADIIPGKMNSIYHLEILSDDDIWKVLWKFALGDKQAEDMRLEEISKQIATRLNGLPLTAKIVGCLLNTKLDVKFWKQISRSDIEGGILPTSKLSLQYLPGPLKICVLYCSLFSKGHIFDKHHLIQLWMAQCFIPREGEKEMEEVGSDYFNDLLARSFFQLRPNNEGYVMNNSIYSLAKFEFKDDCFRMEDDGSEEIPKTVRHITVANDNLEMSKVIGRLCIYESLRTLIFFKGCKIDISLLDKLFSKLKRLRVLGFEDCEVKEFPESIGQLKHLRWLNLSGTPLEKLPDSLSSLHNLQVLILENCWKLHSLPKGITSLINMSHLEANESLISRIDGVGNLTSLQKLESFDAYKYKIRELKGMNQLHVLSIEHLENVKGTEEASQIEFKNKKHLKKLKLRWSPIFSSQNYRPNDEEVLEGLQPNVDLEDLAITGYAGRKFSSWMVNESFLYLEAICLEQCREVVSLPPLGQLQFLKKLIIRGMSGIKQVGNEFYGSTLVAFPKLETLIIEEMSDWEMWKGAEEGQLSFPRLRKLEVRDCPKLIEFPPLPPSVKCLKIILVGVTVLPGLQHNSSTTTSQVLSSSLSLLEINRCSNLTSLREGLLACQLEDLQYLEITHCEELVSLPMKGFGDFISLKTLMIENCPKLEPLIVGALPSSLEKFIIRSHYARFVPKSAPDPRWPEYIAKNSSSGSSSTFDEVLPKCLQQLISLTNLEISGCQSLTSLPGEVLCHLRALEYLKISNCQQLTSLELQSLTSLVQLKISNCPMLVATSTSSSPSLPLVAPKHLLEHLSISNCENLQSLPAELGSLSSLEHLSISDCWNLQSLPAELGSLSSLKHLSISYCGNLLSLPAELGSLSSLEHLSISDCWNLQSLPAELGSLSSLKHLSISGCGNLQSLPAELGSLSSLEHLRISDCGNLQSLPAELGSLSSLKHLSISSYCGNLQSLPAELGSLSSLEHLSISYCGNLQSLPAELGSLSCLKKLKIEDCPQIQSLPDIERLPTSLKRLAIYGCPTLKEQCQEDGGLDWHKISHIPSIAIY